MSRIRVLIIDDSALVRQLLTEILSSDRAIEVIGTAADPYVARDKIKKLKPDVLTLDVEMPKMDGITFLGNLMRLRPMPVVMVSTLTEEGAEVTMRALELGAIDFVSKPKLDLANTLPDYTDEIISKVKNAAEANVRALESSIVDKVSPKLSADAILAKETANSYSTTDKIIAIGASTGGTEAIKDVLYKLPTDCPGIVITQHIPGNFSSSFANRMNLICDMVVCEATDGQQIMTGHAYIAPGNQHLLVERVGKKYVCRLNDGPPVNRHKPSVDVLFRSVAQCAGHNAIGVIMTGMGDDGARGMLEMHGAGSKTIAQDKMSSVIWGMPGQAVEMGGVDHVVPLKGISDKILTLFPKS